jgi:hypothetical protein
VPSLILYLIKSNAACNTPNVWTPFLYKAPPRYLVAFCVSGPRSSAPRFPADIPPPQVNLAASGLAIVFAVATRIYLKKKNEEMDRGDYSARGAPTEQQIQNGYRYIL